jgi:ElaB/YqjD/DUF883 family membrane-anchored ribosome-binding protein
MSTMDDLAAAESKDQLVTNLRRVIADAEELLSATADEGSGKLADLRERIKDNLRVARDKLADADALMRDHARRAAEVTDDYVHDNPWTSMGVAAAVGMFIGVLLGRR